MGRPKGTLGLETKNITPDLVTALCTVLPNTEELIADYLGISHKTLRRRFSEEIKRGRAIGHKQLSSWQWANAQKGNVTMQIFLGKNYKQQAEKIEAKHDVEQKGEIKLKYSLDD